MALRIHEASADEQEGYERIEVEGPNGSAETYWVGDVLMTVAPNQIEKMALERQRQRPGRIMVYVSTDVGNEYTTITEEATGGHLAFSLGGEAFMVPRVMEPLQGNPITLFNVPGGLLARFTEEVWDTMGS